MTAAAIITVEIIQRVIVLERSYYSQEVGSKKMIGSSIYGVA